MSEPDLNGGDAASSSTGAGATGSAPSLKPAGTEPSPIGRFIRIFAGVDEKRLRWVPEERPRYTGLGGSVLTTGLLAFISMSFAIVEMIGYWSPYILAPALVWFILILNFDRWLVSTPMGQGVRRRLPALLLRIGMAVFFGIVIAEPLVLRVFQTAIIQEVKDERTRQLNNYRGDLERCNPTPPVDTPPAGCDKLVAPAPKDLVAARTELEQKKATATALANNLKDVDAQLAGLRENERKECAGNSGVGLTGRRGEGPACGRLRREADQFSESNQIPQKHSQLDALNQEIVQLTSKVGAATANWGATRQKFIDDQVADWQSHRQGEPGLLERMAALAALASHNRSLDISIWVVRLLFILVDCAPALLKFTSGATSYDKLTAQRLEVGELQFATSVAAAAEEAKAWSVRQSGQLAVGEVRHSADLIAKRDQIVEELERSWSKTRMGSQEPQPSQVPEKDFMLVPPTGGGSYGYQDYPHDAEPVERNNDPAELNEPADIPHIPHFKVAMLGTRGIGKTALLAMMYAELTFDPESRRGYWLSCADAEKRQHLNRQAAKVRKLGDEWPDPTGLDRQVEEFIFDCYVTVGRTDPLPTTHPVLRIRYWDYAGEALESGSEIEFGIRDLINRNVRHADVLVMALDGAKIRDCEHNRISKDEFDQMIWEQAQWATQARCPIHILVTKWDRLAEDGWSLIDVRAWLRRFPAFQRLIEHLDRQGPANRDGQGPVIRLIPVSVVGSGVVEETIYPDGTPSMRKIKQIVPINVDVPLAALVPDHLAGFFRELRAGQLRWLFRRALWYTSRLWFWIAFAVMRNALFGFFRRLSVSVSFPPSVTLSWNERPWDKEAVRADPEAGWATVYLLPQVEKARRDSEAAMALYRDAVELRRRQGPAVEAKDLLLKAFRKRLQVFEAEYPGWHLGGDPKVEFLNARK